MPKCYHSKVGVRHILQVEGERRKNYVKSPDKDEQLLQEEHPIRHESQVHGLLRTLKEDRAFAKSTNPREEPLMKHAHSGRQHKFDPLWYPELIAWQGNFLTAWDLTRRLIRFVLRKFSLRSCHCQQKRSPSIRPSTNQTRPVARNHIAAHCPFP